MRKATLALGALLVLSVSATAQTPMELGLDTAFALTGQPWSLSTKENVAIDGKTDFFEAAAELSINSDGKYGADIANFSASKNFFNNYFYLEKGYMIFRPSPVTFQVGRFAQYDTFDSPYSLFLNSLGRSANSMVLKYQDSFFSYETRWIELTARSNFGTTSDTPTAWRYVWNATSQTYEMTGTSFPDRGANLKTFLFHFGDLRIGLQDAAIYTGRSFDLEYFVSPMPAYFTQYVKNTAGRPWTTSGNENNLLGFFVDYNQPAYDLGLQVLVDDFSLHFLFPDQVPNNPWKAAWTVGGRVKTDWGRFGLYHAGALKYTFEPITTSAGQDSESSYGYTYYPDVEYSVGNGVFRALGITDNSLGYLYGENNLAVRATYDNPIDSLLSWETNLEFLLAGANSSGNPWQDVTASDQTGGTQWLDDAVLQRSLVWTSELKWKSGDWGLFTKWHLGYISNVLALTTATGSDSASGWSAIDRYVRIFKPSSDSKAVADLTIGVTWHFDVSGFQRFMTGTR